MNNVPQEGKLYYLSHRVIWFGLVIVDGLMQSPFVNRLWLKAYNSKLETNVQCWKWEWHQIIFCVIWSRKCVGSPVSVGPISYKVIIEWK